jgi:Two component regulator propeller
MLRFVYRMRRLFLYIALGLTATGLNAQRFDYIFNRITTDDGMGLRVNNIHSIYRDAKGFIWIGNSNGLQRFDGSKFVSFDPAGTKPHPVTAYGWLLTEQNSLAYLTLQNSGMKVSH